MGTSFPKAAKLNFFQIKVGDECYFEKVISEKDVQDFAQLTGDFNPLHVDHAFGSKSQFGQPVVHGMLAGSLFSALVGMKCPGENSLYLSQTLNFRRPLFHGDRITVKGTVVNKNDSIQVIHLKTEILKEGKILIDGEAMVKVIG